jgi:group I intron endonuclease
MVKSAGIYKISNNVDGKFYIGSTIHLERRFKEHKTALKKGTHPNYKLQKAFYEVGIDSLKFEIFIYFS